MFQYPHLSWTTMVIGTDCVIRPLEAHRRAVYVPTGGTGSNITWT
jgi:hypothetical protein